MQSPVLSGLMATLGWERRESRMILSGDQARPLSKTGRGPRITRGVYQNSGPGGDNSSTDRKQECDCDSARE